VHLACGIIRARAHPRLAVDMTKCLIAVDFNSSSLPSSHLIMFSSTRSTSLRYFRARLRPLSASYTPQFSAFARLVSSLAVLEQREGKLNSASLAAVAAAQKLGGSVTAFVAGSSTKPVAEEAAKVKGVDKVIFVENGAYEKGLPENFAPLLVENVKKGGFTHILAGHSAFGKGLMPRVAALLDSQMVSDITGIENEDSKASISAP